MKRNSLLALLTLVLASSASGQPAQFYVNDGVVLCPPAIPPQIDAVNFVNNNYMSITFTNLWSTFLFQPSDTLNFTNRGYLSVSPGIDFRYVTANSNLRVPAANFYNTGTIRTGSETNLALYGNNVLTWVGLPQFRLNAANIYNPGSISLGYDGLCFLTGDNVDLSRGALMMTNAGVNVYNSINNVALFTSFFYNGGIYDGYWGMDTNVFSLAAYFGGNQPLTIPHTVTNRWEEVYRQQLRLPPSGLTYYNETISGSNRLVQVVYLNNTNAVFSPNVYFINGAFNANDIVVEWAHLSTNSITGVAQTNYVYVIDDYPDLLVDFLMLNGFAGVGLRPTYMPYNYTVTQLPFPLNLGNPAPASAIPPQLFPIQASSNVWSAYEALLPPSAATLGDIAGQDLTNTPGRIEIDAGQALDLTLAQIRSLSYLSLRATNQFLGSRKARIGSPYSDINLRSTNGTLEISDLLVPMLIQPEGFIDLWSTCVTNVTGTSTNVFHVLFVDGHLAPLTPSRVQSLTLTVTNTLGGDDNLIIRDVFNVTRNLSLDATRVTIETNVPGSSVPCGAINLQNSDIVWPGATPHLQYLTNNGIIQTYNAVFFSGSRSSPFYNTNYNESYVAFVNRGAVTNNGSLIWASDFENSGIFSSYVGDIQLQQARNAILTNSLMTATNGNIDLSSGYMLVSNTVLAAGNSLTLSVTNALTDGVPNLAAVDPSNYLTLQVTNGNVWLAGNGGVRLPVKPLVGDLLGTTITNTATPFTRVPIVWAGADLGNSSAGFVNNAAVGRLVLVGSTNSLFAFSGVGGNNALYVDSLELDGTAAFDADAQGNFTGLQVMPGMKVYYGQAIANGVSVAEKLNGRNGGGFIWVSNYTAGYFSSVLWPYPDGTTNRLNAALVASCSLVSNLTNNPPVVNCANPVPVWPLAPVTACSNNVPLLAGISTAPQSQAVVRGGPVTFTAVPSSIAPVTFQWRKNGANIAGATTSSLTIDQVQPGDAGLYSVAITSFIGTVISADARLTVNVPAGIIAQPQDLTVAPYSPAIFSVTAFGTAPLSYQWLVNGAPIAAATRSVYSQANATVDNAGAYQVVVSNPFGSVTSQVAGLTVVPNLPPGPANPALAQPHVATSPVKASTDAFLLAVGTYNGLFSDNNGAAPDSSGYFSARVTRGGAYTARLTVGGRTYSASGAFNPATSAASRTINRGRTLSPLALNLRLDLAAGGQVFGTVSAGTNWTSDLLAFRPAPSTPATYTMVIPHSAVAGTVPAGDGYGTVKIDAAGNVRFAGALADGVKVTQSTTRSQPGYWPLFGSVYSGKGCVMSWVAATNSDAAMSAQVLWLKTSGADKTYYSSGFTNDVSAAGSLYTPASALAHLQSARIVLSGGALTSPVVNTFTLDARNRVIRPAGSRLSLSFNTASGLFTGSTWVPQLNRTVTFQGVLSGQGTGGSGYFLSPQQSGQVSLEPLPVP